MIDYKIYSIYRIVDSRNLPYIGMTENIQQRIYNHKRSKRFLLDSFDFSIIYQSKDYEHIQDMEEFFVNEHNSFYKGLNETKSGKGWGHNSKKFTTTGYKYSQESRELMSKKALARIKNGSHPFLTKKHVFSNEERKRISLKTKGKIFSQTLSNFDVLEIKRCYTVKPYLNLESASPRFESYKTAFIFMYSKIFGVSITAIRDILDGKSYKNKNIKKTAKISFNDAEKIRANYGKINLESLLRLKLYRPYDRVFSEVISKRYNVTNVHIYNIIKEKNFQNIKVNITNKILTLNGYESFDGIIKTRHLEYYNIVLSDLSKITCSRQHKFLTNTGEFKTIEDFVETDRFYAGNVNNGLRVISRQLVKESIDLYDIINSGKMSSYYSNGVISHNCQFISTKGTLIASTFLEKLRPVESIEKRGDLEIFKPIENRRLGLAVDVGTGTGQDFSVIQAFDLDTLEQVAQYRNNKLTLTEFTKEFLSILTFIKNERKCGDLFFTVESNSIGQGIMTLLENSRNPILDKVEFIHESSTKKGLLTTSKSKLRGCTKFKDLVESGRMKIYSKKLISELRFFVKSGDSFKAESGMTDDLAMGCVILTNMLAIIAEYDPEIYERITDLGEEFAINEDQPLPFIF